MVYPVQSVSIVRVMDDDPPTALPSTPLDELRRAFCEQDSPIPVVNRARHVLGVVRKGDVAPETDRLEVPDAGAAPLVGSESPRVAEDVMVPAIFLLDVQSTVVEAAALMSREAVTYLVVHDGGKLAGLVTSRHLLRWLAQRGGYIVRGDHDKGR